MSNYAKKRRFFARGTSSGSTESELLEEDSIDFSKIELSTFSLRTNSRGSDPFGTEKEW
jgi:hypothetical protein